MQLLGRVLVSNTAAIMTVLGAFVEQELLLHAVECTFLDPCQTNNRGEGRGASKVVHNRNRS